MAKKSIVIGVLALQGAFAKHAEMLRSLNVTVQEVRYPHDLALCDGLIIPGGESTTIMHHLRNHNLQLAIKDFAKEKPIFGTCAGLILMSREILADNMQPLQLLDVVVERNAFGRQIGSFKAEVDIQFESHRTHRFQAFFIRAPRIRQVSLPVTILASYEGEAILVQQGFHLGATFHPELTHDSAIHRHFVELVEERK